MQRISMTAFTCSLRREGCLMDKNRQVIWEMSYDVPTVLAPMAAICLWDFVASAAMIYSSDSGVGNHPDYPSQPLPRYA
jgi:hypothetical protein